VKDILYTSILERLQISYSTLTWNNPINVRPTRFARCLYHDDKEFFVRHNQELSILIDECHSFVEDITVYASTDELSPFKILSLDYHGSDSYTYDSEFDAANILVCRNLLRERYQGIDPYLHLFPQYSKKQVLKEMYLHILDHELYHFRNENRKAFKLKNSGEELTEQEIKIIRDEEYSAENYAIKMAEKRGDLYLSNIAMIIESIIRVHMIMDQGHEEKEDVFHMSDEEIIKKMYSQEYSEEQKGIISSLAKNIGLPIAST
jgi:hypothetical protein